MVISEIRQLEAEISSFQNIIGFYSADWDDVVSERIFSSVSSLASDISSLYSELDNDMNMLISLESQLRNLADK